MIYVQCNDNFYQYKRKGNWTGWSYDTRGNVRDEKKCSKWEKDEGSG